jgi:hypothetical protein
MEAVGDLDDDVEAGVPAASLDRGKVGPVDVGPLSQLFLCPTSLRACPTDSIAEGPPVGDLVEGASGWHHPDDSGDLTRSPYSISNIAGVSDAPKRRRFGVSHGALHPSRAARDNSRVRPRADLCGATICHKGGQMSEPDQGTTVQSGAERNCRNGHLVPTAQPFCGICGSAAQPETAAGPTGDTQAGQDAPSALSAPATQTRAAQLLGRVGSGVDSVACRLGLGQSQRAGRAIVVGFSALVTLLIVVSLVVASQGGDAVPLRTASSTSTQSPHDTCVLQLTATIADVVDNSDQGFLSEMQINGQVDPYFKEAMNMEGQVAQDQVTVGTTQALANLRVAAGHVCTSDLGNQIRPNFPTDGSHP